MYLSTIIVAKCTPTSSTRSVSKQLFTEAAVTKFGSSSKKEKIKSLASVTIKSKSVTTKKENQDVEEENECEEVKSGEEEEVEEIEVSEEEEKKKIKKSKEEEVEEIKESKEEEEQLSTPKARK
ncbi:hypothetical protein C8Q75DRAFT_735614 [Abortiporus biennis]|nr:hypothetical protein C8Q75DRAFT_735614 [Abortiporus biennis]